MLSLQTSSKKSLTIKRSLYNYHDSRIHIASILLLPTGHSLNLWT